MNIRCRLLHLLGAAATVFTALPAALPASPASAVAALTVSNLGTTSVTLNWGGGVSQTQFIRQCTVVGCDPWDAPSATTVVSNLSSSTTTYTVTGLASGTYYAFNVVYDSPARTNIVEITTFGSTSNGWQTRASMSVPRNGAVGGMIDGTFYAATGGNTSCPTPLSSIEAYDPAANIWKTKTAMPVGKSSAFGGVIGSKLYVVGGYLCDSNQPQSSGYAYTASDDTWATISSAPRLRGDGASAAVDGKLYITGGWNRPSSSVNSPELDIFDPTVGANGTWTSGTNIPTAAEGAAGASLGGKFYVVGGYVRTSASSGAYTGNLYVYDPTSNAWDSTRAAMPTARGGAMAIAVDGKLHVLGGHNDSGYLSTHEVFDPALNTWTTSNAMQSPRSYPAAAANGNTMLVAGGYSGSAYLATTESFDVVTATETCLTPVSGAVSWWPGDSHASDLKLTNNGTLQNGATYTGGRVGQGFSFDGIDDYLLIPDSTSLDLTTDITIEGWVMPRKTGQDSGAPILSKGVGAEEAYVLDFNSGTELRFVFRKASNPNDFASVSSPGWLTSSKVNAWSHIAATYSSSTGDLKLYANGALLNTATTDTGTAMRTNNDPVTLGSRQGGSTTFDLNLDAIVDEVGLYSRALSATEIASIFNAGTAGKCKASKLGFPAPPTNGAPSVTLAAVTVAVQDAVGNTVTDSPATVSLSLSPVATLSGTTSKATTSGLATFSDLSIAACGTYTMTADGGALSSATSGSFTISGCPLPTISISDVTATEPAVVSTMSQATFTVSLSSTATQDVTVPYFTGGEGDTATGGGSGNPPVCTSGADYITQSGTVTISQGTSSTPLIIQVCGDTVSESSETFTVTLSTPTNATLSDAVGIGTIQNYAVPSISITDVTVAEPASSMTQATFTVALSNTTTAQVQVAYATSTGNGATGGGSGQAPTCDGSFDYITTSGTLTLDAGATSTSVIVQVCADALDEASETFTVVLSNAVNATISDSSGTGTITDSTAAPSLSINNVTQAEGNSASAPALFTATLSAASGQVVTANYASASGTAIGGADCTSSDFVSVSGSLSFPAGTTTQSLSVNVCGDTAPEEDEAFTVVLSNAVNATLGTSTGTGTITSDDTPLGAVITRIQPQGGVAGAKVKIDGINFGAAPTVNWGATNITETCSGTATGCISSKSTKSITVIAPSGTADVLVTVNEGSALVSVDNTFYYNPVVTRVSPQGGAKGAKVKVEGVNFPATGLSVDWGDQTYTLADHKCSTTLKDGCIASANSKSVTLVAPEGTNDAAIYVNGGSAAINIDNTFYYQTAITGMKPQGGPTAGGTKVKIDGVNFPATTPTIDWGDATIDELCTTDLTMGCISSFSTKSVTVISPASTEDALIAVNGGTFALTIDPTFYYTAVVTGLKPQGGPQGTKVKIDGINFPATGLSVDWGNATITLADDKCSKTKTDGCIQSANTKSITLVAPASSENVAVYVGGGSSLKTLDNTFYYPASADSGLRVTKAGVKPIVKKPPRHR